MSTTSAVASATSSAINQATCSLNTCPIHDSYFYYQPWMIPNIIFMGGAVLAFANVFIHIFFCRKFVMWIIAMLIGCGMEIAGYFFRIQGHSNPFSQGAYTGQFAALTIAPAFLAGGIYMCLARVVDTYGSANSRLPPKWYPRIFVTCDIVSILLQGIGGGMSSSASNSGKSPTTGNTIVIIGLVFQVITMTCFAGLAADFAHRTKQQVKRLGGRNALDPRNETLRNSRLFKAFLIAYAIATFLIWARCIYRVVEFSGGYQGPIIRDQITFVLFESCLVIPAILLLSFFHPHLAFRLIGAKKRADDKERAMNNFA